MAEPFTLQTLLTYLTLISVPVGVFYHIMTLRNTRRNQELQLESRQAQMFMQVFQEDIIHRGPHGLMDLLDWEFSDADDFDAKYGREVNPEAYKSYSYWTNYMEGMGVMVREGYINIRLIALLSSGAVKSLWRKFQPLIYEERERHNWPRWGVEFEYLYDALMDYAEKHPELQI